MKVFITGIAGTLGTEVTRQLLTLGGYEIVGYSRDEFKQQAFPYKDRVTLYLGDVRDRERLVEATRGCELIFHFAALKHVDLLEMNPEEAIRTNINGTENVLYAQRVNKIPKIIFSSTDKAVEPLNVYGCSKLIGERLVLRNEKNVVCRWGNVVASNGSVIPTFVKSILSYGGAPITDSRMTRFFISIEDAVQFMIAAMNRNEGGLFIPEMKSARIESVADVVAEILSKPVPSKMIIGLRPGEKIHEQLRLEAEGGAMNSYTAKKFSWEELRDLVRPSVENLL